MQTTREKITFSSGEHTLEGILHLPASPGKHPGVVVCHPHPRFGGNMDDNVVTALANALCDAGIAALRFNFRGVGGSEGVFDQGKGEIDDAVEAADWLALHDGIEPAKLGIAGYSFGAWMALEACDLTTAIVAVASFACPLSPFNRLSSREMLQPKLLVLGEFDHDFPSSQFNFISRRFHQPRQIELIEGADHFFRGQEPELSELTTSFFNRWIGDDPGYSG